MIHENVENWITNWSSKLINIAMYVSMNVSQLIHSCEKNSFFFIENENIESACYFELNRKN